MKVIISGIYVIEYVPDGRKYIGYATNMDCRWKKHKKDLEMNRHDNDYLQKTYNKYGKECFIYYIIEELSNDIDNLKIIEKYWIKFYHTFEDKTKGFNLTEGGD